MTKSRLEGSLDDFIFESPKVLSIKKSEKGTHTKLVTVHRKGTTFKRKQRVGRKEEEKVIISKKPHAEKHILTGMPDIDARIEMTMSEYEERVNRGESPIFAISDMAKSDSVYDYKSDKPDPKIDITISKLSKISSDGIMGIPEVKIKFINGFRSWYRPVESEIDIGAGCDTKPSLYHEMGHHIEDSNSVIRQSCVNFRDNRTKNESIIKLKDLFPNNGYGDNEIAKIDKFITPYIGSIYEDDIATEIFSMGLEKFVDNHSMREFKKEDPDHFALVLTGILGRL